MGVFSDVGLQARVREEKWRTITDSIIMRWVDIATVEQVRTQDCCRFAALATFSLPRADDCVSLALYAFTLRFLVHFPLDFDTFALRFLYIYP